MRGHASDDGNDDNPYAGNLSGNDPARNRPTQDGEIGPGFDKARSAQNLIFFKMLGQNRIFNWAKEGGMHAHCEQCDEHHRYVVQVDTRCTEDHDKNLGCLYHANDARLFDGIGQLSRKRGKQEKG